MKYIWYNLITDCEGTKEKNETIYSLDSELNKNYHSLTRQKKRPNGIYFTREDLLELSEHSHLHWKLRRLASTVR